MCTIGANTASVISDLAQNTISIASNVINYKTNKKSLEYRTQVAINNAQTAKNEALNQRQTGIEEARKEKIEGIQKSKRQLAQNAASGFDANSQTSTYNYEDTITQANADAKTIQDSYEYQADTYFQKASNYLYEAKGYQNDYNSLAYSTALNALGTTQKVASNWYNSKKGENV